METKKPINDFPNVSLNATIDLIERAFDHFMPGYVISKAEIERWLLGKEDE